MVDVIVLGIIQAEVYMLMYTYGLELGALLSIPAIVVTLAPMLPHCLLLRMRRAVFPQPARGERAAA
jgi:hypothetical protein